MYSQTFFPSGIRTTELSWKTTNDLDFTGLECPADAWVVYKVSDNSLMHGSYICYERFL